MSITIRDERGEEDAANLSGMVCNRTLPRYLSQSVMGSIALVSITVSEGRGGARGKKRIHQDLPGSIRIH